MIKRFIKDNRGQVLYAVMVTVMFMGTISMITMGLTLSNYRATLQKQQHVTDYYAADAVAELIRTGVYNDDTKADIQEKWNVDVSLKDGVYTIKGDTATIVAVIDTEKQQFKSWEVSYHAVETETDEANLAQE